MTTQQCTICTHDEHALIDDALGSGSTLRSLAERFGVSRAALSRHGQHRNGKALAQVDISPTTSTRKFSAWGQVGDRLEELTTLVGRVGAVGAQRQDARLVLAACKTEIETLIRISERLPQSPEAIFAEGRDRALTAVGTALSESVADRDLLARVIVAVNHELIRQGVEQPAEVA